MYDNRHRFETAPPTAPPPVVPPVLYLPVVDLPLPCGQMFVVRVLTNGRKGLLAYTALDRLAANCGERQPWILMPTPELGRVREVQSFDVVAFDLAVPSSQLRDERLA